MKKWLISFFMLLLVSPFAHSKVRCSDFSTQREAQAYMYYYRAFWLDRDRDGEACECLPGGSKHGSSKCRKRR